MDDKTFDEIYDKFCDYYEDDGSYEEQLRSELIDLIENQKGVKELKQ